MVYNSVRPLELYIYAQKKLKSGGGCDKEKSTQVIIIMPTLRSQWLFHMGRKKNYYKLQGPGRKCLAGKLLLLLVVVVSSTVYTLTAPHHLKLLSVQVYCR